MESTSYTPRRPGHPGNWKRHAGALVVACCLLALLSACGDSAECETDSDCGQTEVCAANGGVFFGDKQCLPVGAPADATVDEDVATDANGMEDRGIADTRMDSVPDPHGGSDGGEPDTSDDTPPTSLNFDNLNAGQAVSGSVSIAVSATDVDSGIAELRVSYADGLIGVVRGSSGGVVWDTNALLDGLRTLELTAIDAAGNESTSTLTVVVDNEGPTISIDNPADGSAVSNTVFVEVSASDATTSVQEIRLAADGTTIVSSASTPLSYQLDTTLLSPGASTLTAEATDEVGNTTSSSVTVTVDNTAPTVTITSPNDGATAKGTMLISANASDADTGIASMKFSVRGATIASSSSSPIGTGWDTTNYASGPANLVAQATDQAGNTAKDSVQVNILNP